MNSWGRKEWIGKLYPEKTNERKFLFEYVKHFNAIELNATHFQTFTADEIKKWTDQVIGADFYFCPKFPQNISHYSSFREIEDKTIAFLDSISNFGKHLGPVFLQLSSRYTPAKIDSFYNYLESLPNDKQFFVEVTNESWYEERTYKEHLSFLATNKIGGVIRDLPDKVLSDRLSIPKAMIRFTPSIDTQRIVKWRDKIRKWEASGLQEVYFFVEATDRPLLALEQLQILQKLVTSAS